MSMSLRNELRNPYDNPNLNITQYGWSDWYDNMIPAATTIHTANPNTLIFFSGLNFDATMAPISTGANLTTATGVTTNQRFIASSFDFADKIVLEIHNYEGGATNCGSLEAELVTDGYNAMTKSGIRNVLPVVMTEFGVSAFSLMSSVK